MSMLTPDEGIQLVLAYMVTMDTRYDWLVLGMLARVSCWKAFLNLRINRVEVIESHFKKITSKDIFHVLVIEK